MKKETYKIIKKIEVWWCDFCNSPMLINSKNIPPKDNDMAYYRKCKRCGKAMCEDCYTKQGKHDIGGMYSYGTGIRCKKCYQIECQNSIKKKIEKHKLKIEKLKLDLL